MLGTITQSMLTNGIGIDMRLVVSCKFSSSGNIMCHKHLLCSRYGLMQVNPDVIGILEDAGLKFVGKDDSRRRMEVGFLLV